MITLWRRLAAVCVLLAAVLTAPLAEAQGRRIALVVGNAHYQNLPELATPGEDASRMAEALRRLGFEVTLLSDVSDSMFRAMLDVVASQAKGADAVVFYYAGHAYQIAGENHLLPVEARPDATAPSAGTWSMSEILGKLQSTGATTLVFLDACRTNPLGASVGGDGLAAMDGANGTFVAFATRPGQVSYDKGTGEVSPFAAALLTHIETPGIGISDLMIRVRRDVEAATVGRQVPWDQSSLREPFAFAGTPPAAPGAGEGDEVDPFAELEIVADDSLFASLGATETLPAAPEPVLVREAPATDPVTEAPAPEPAPELAPVVEAPKPEPAPETVPVVEAPAPAPAPVLKTATLAALGGTAAPLAAVSGADALSSRRELARLVAGTAPLRLGAGDEGAPATELPRLAMVTAAERTRIIGMSPQAEPVPGSDPATAALPAPSPEDLPRAVQEELARVGCYGQGIDGDWGGGSRAALKGYYDAKKTTPVEPLDPTEALWRQLKAEPAGICKEAVAAAPKPAAKKPAAKKPAATKPAAAKPKPAAKPAPKPAEKKGVTCKFMVVAIVCK